LNSSDQILPFDGAAYNFGAYVAVGDGTWTVYDAFFNEVTKPAGWVPTFEIGSAFVMQYASGSGTNVIVGQVQNDQTTTFTYDMTAPFSSKLPIDVTAQDFVGVLQNSDQILTFDAVNYNFESYIFDGVSTFTHYDAFFNEMPPVSGSMVILPIGTGAIFIGNGDAESAPRVWLQHANL
jgi:hypothetical protein